MRLLLLLLLLLLFLLLAATVHLPQLPIRSAKEVAPAPSFEAVTLVFFSPGYFFFFPPLIMFGSVPGCAALSWAFRLSRVSSPPPFQVDLVVNMEIPSHGKDYIHRVGRTARAGRAGRSIAFVTQVSVLAAVPRQGRITRRGFVDGFRAHAHACPGPRSSAHTTLDTGRVFGVRTAQPILQRMPRAAADRSPSLTWYKVIRSRRSSAE